MNRRPQVALLIETSNAYARGLLEGVAAYVREHQSWSIYLSEHGRGDSLPAWLRGWKGDGIIARAENRRIARAVVDRRLPTVDLSAAGLLRDAPCVETDNQAIARHALAHLLDRGFRHVGFCGLTDYRWSLSRREHFERLARAAGRDCHVHMAARKADRPADWSADQRALARWARVLPKPIGIMACFDMRGRQLLDACRSSSIRVPDDVAVVGVDDDALLCELADPPLSSVAPDAHRTGYLAAELLQKMMTRQIVPSDLHLIEPLGVVTRKSTDALAIDDPEISDIVRYIREHACDGIDVSDVLRQAAMSRRILEARFRRLLRRTPHEEILRCRIERAKALLAGTDLPLKTVAERSGIRHAEYMSVVFKRETGQSPASYRRHAAGKFGPRLR